MSQLHGLLSVRRQLQRRSKKKPQDKSPTLGIRTRFSRASTGTVAKHSRDMIRLEVVRRRNAGQGVTRIARELGLADSTVENWVYQTKLPKKPTSPYTFDRMLACVTLARQFYRQKFSANPRYCMIEAVKRTPGMKWTSVDVYLSLEAVPALPGFPLYADQAVQARCEALARGERERGTDIFDAPVLPPPVVSHPAPSAPEPSAPRAMPVVRIPVVDREKFLSCRSRLGLPSLRL